MSITHIVLFKFASGLAAEKVQETVNNLFRLKTLCVHPTTQAPYVRAIKGGRDNSPEGLQRGFTHAFVIEFASVADRDYYTATDPAHRAFVQSIAGVVEEALVVDFADGQQ